MGLDMYLYATKYVDDYNDKPLLAKILKAVPLGDKISENSGNFKSASVEIRAAYWRKANAIHGWFVNNLANGVDECQRIEVGRESLQELYDLCEAAIKTGKAEALAPVGGFFFGSTEINEGYWEDLKDTVRQLKPLLALPPDWEFYYRASW